MIAAGFAAYLTTRSTDPSQDLRPTRAPLTAERAAALGEVLVGADTQKIAALMSASVRPTYEAAPGLLWQRGTFLHIAASSFHRLGPDVATVSASTTGVTSGRCTLLISWEGGDWTLVATTQIPR